MNKSRAHRPVRAQSRSKPKAEQPAAPRLIRPRDREHADHCLQSPYPGRTLELWFLTIASASDAR